MLRSNDLLDAISESRSHYDSRLKPKRTPITVKRPTIKQQPIRKKEEPRELVVRSTLKLPTQKKEKPKEPRKVLIEADTYDIFDYPADIFDDYEDIPEDKEYVSPILHNRPAPLPVVEEVVEIPTKKVFPVSRPNIDVEAPVEPVETSLEESDTDVLVSPEEAEEEDLREWDPLYDLDLETQRSWMETEQAESALKRLQFEKERLALEEEVEQEKQRLNEIKRKERKMDVNRTLTNLISYPGALPEEIEEVEEIIPEVRGEALKAGAPTSKFYRNDRNKGKITSNTMVGRERPKRESSALFNKFLSSL